MLKPDGFKLTETRRKVNHVIINLVVIILIRIYLLPSLTLFNPSMASNLLNA